MERVTRALFVCLVNIIIAVAFVIMGCTHEPNTTTTTTPPTTTTTTTTPPTTTTATNTDYLVLNLAAPDAPDRKTSYELFNIYVIVTNTRNSQLSCDIPIIITDAVDPTQIVTYVVSVTLGPNETKEFVFDTAALHIGYYTMQAGDVIKPLQVG